MPTPLSGVRKLLGFASALLGNATRGSLTQSWAWATFRAAAEAAGAEVTGVSASDMSRLIGWVNQSLTARDNFAAMRGTQTVGADAIAPYATYMLSSSVAVSPKFALTTNIEVTITGESTTVRYWQELTGVTSMTKDALLSLITAGIATMQAATPTTYGASVVSVTDVTIYRI